MLILRDLTDDEILKLTGDDLYDLRKEYETNGVPYRATVKSLLEDYNIKYDDLSDFILGFEVGYCNYANRTPERIIIKRKGSLKKDNILINLNKDYDVPDIVLQIQVDDDFVHEEAYTSDGFPLYRA